MLMIFRPLGPWPRAQSRPQRSQFTASWSDTLELLDREVSALRFRGDDEPVVLQVDAPESAMRMDGGIRANATVGFHGVILSFSSKHGPLRYLCDTYSQRAWARNGLPPWQSNVRAIALGLEALRTVDRHGIASDGEQYRGFTALPPAREAGPAMTVEDAARFVAEHGAPSLLEFGGWMNLASPLYSAELDRAYRGAAKRLHPDAGGDAAMFRRLTEAVELLRRGGA